MTERVVALPRRTLEFGPERQAAIDPSVEWIVTNGLGGYASAPVSGGLTRRYHGLLVAALPRRRVALSTWPACRHRWCTAIAR